MSTVLTNALAMLFYGSTHLTVHLSAHGSNVPAMEKDKLSFIRKDMID